MTSSLRCWSSVRPKLSESLISALNSSGFEHMTPVQAATLPQLLSHRDVAVQACTGSGKTLSFLVPIIETLLRRKDDNQLDHMDVGAMIISPTRELAHQIYYVLKQLLRAMKPPPIDNASSEEMQSTSVSMNDEGNAEDRLEEEEPSLLGVLLLVGGVSTDADANSLATHGANIIVATPGRLEDALCSGKRLKQLNVRTLEMLILDEADRLLDLGFSTSINEILKRVPKQRRTGLFSATQTREVESLVRAGLRNPARIDVQLKLKDGAQAQLTPLSLRNRFRVVPSEQRLDELVHVLTGEPERHTIVFVLTCAMVEYLGSVLPNLAAVRQAGIQVQPLHGRMKQSRRNKEFAAFRDRCSKVDGDGSVRGGSVLVCTDVVARGVDIAGVARIVQFEAPQDPSYFVHRVGRTARAGADGDALILLEAHERDFIELLRVRQVPMTESACLSTAESAATTTAQVRALALADRDLMEKGQRAFVSQVRAYCEHHCKYIFQLDNVQLHRVATSMGLLFMPRMPEVKKADLDAFVGVTSVQADDVAYADKVREKHRQQSLQAEQQRRREAKLQRQRERRNASQREKKFVKQRRKRKQSETQDRKAEWEELEHETKELRRLRRGKINKVEFELSVGERSMEDIAAAKKRQLLKHFEF